MKKYFVVFGLLVICGACSARTLAQGPNYVGFVDRVDCHRMAGWAADKNRPNVPINVSVYVDSNSSPLMTVLANIQREPAVGAAVGSGDNGQHGFDFGAPLKDGQPHTFTFKFESSSTLVTNGAGPNPASLTCGAFNAGTATVDVLVVDFKLNNGAVSVRNRLAGLSFSVRERKGENSHDVTSEVTHYRLRESPNLLDASLSSQPWTEMPQHALIMELAERNGAGLRYGERKVMFQVKTTKLTSPIVSDTITLEPVLKEYRVSASGGVHPLIQYAASQGFQFPLDFYETCQGSCPATVLADTALDSGSATVVVQSLSSTTNPNTDKVAYVFCKIITLGILSCDNTVAPLPGGTCSTKADYLLFEVRSPNQFWRIKSVDVPGTHVVNHGANRFRAKFSFDTKDARCFPPKQISIGDVVLEGPEVDDFVDPANPWKNAFVRPTLPPITQPGDIRRPN